MSYRTSNLPFDTGEITGRVEMTRHFLERA